MDPKPFTYEHFIQAVQSLKDDMLMYYIDVHGFLEHPEKDWDEALEKALEAPPESEQN